jgi:flagellar biosynthesis/type III secretory pathway protein FliH
MLSFGQKLEKQAYDKGLAQGIDQGLAQGINQGINQGRDEGRHDGQRALVLRQLRVRFGSVPKRTAQRIARAGTTELERWAERILDARSINDVFAS